MIFIVKKNLCDTLNLGDDFEPPYGTNRLAQGSGEFGIKENIILEFNKYLLIFFIFVRLVKK